MLTEENFVEKFLEALATPKNSIVTELLSNNGQFGQENLTDEGELGYNEYKWKKGQ
jgi:hypothetical protein